MQSTATKIHTTEGSIWNGSTAKVDSSNFQTPPEVAKYMCDMIPQGAITIMEPSCGSGNILAHLAGYTVTAPADFFKHNSEDKYDAIVMNPPFSSKYAFGIPDDFEHKGMRLGYYFLTECMKRSGHVIALMPWFTISDSDVRLRFLNEYGIKSITALPRKTFKYARIQTCVLELVKGWPSITEFKIFNF